MAMRVGQGGDRLSSPAMRLAHASGMTMLASWLQAGRGCLINLHRVAPAGCWAGLPNRGFYVNAAFLGRLLDHLAETGWAVVTMDEAVARIRTGGNGRFVNFSIDDVYRDSAEVAVPVFRSRKLPVTLFVTTGIPDRTMLMWTSGLETVLLERDRVVLDDGSIAEAGSAGTKRLLFARLQAEWEASRPHARYARFCALNGYTPDALHDRNAVTWDMLEALRDDPWVEIGSHTMTHPRLSELSDDEAAAEVAGSRSRLQERLRLPVRHFAYPYGRQRDCGAREFAIAQRAGFTSAATTRKGLAGACSRTRLHALPRNTLNGAHQHIAQAEVHLSGLGGWLARAVGAT